MCLHTGMMTTCHHSSMTLLMNCVYMYLRRTYLRSINALAWFKAEI